MHPDVGIFNLQWYSVLMVLGLVSAVVLLRILCGIKKVEDKVYNFYSLLGVVSIGVGIGAAILFQSIYDFIENPALGFHITGMTFMGGLIGGVVTFVGGTWIFAKGIVKTSFYRIANLAAPCIVSAHMFGRIGCFMAGCCYGKPTDSFLGILFPGDAHKVLPTQLFEAIFLALLLATLLVLIIKFDKPDFAMILYLYAYAVFRFILEFFRGDERGNFIPGLSPSQAQCIVMLLAAIALTVLVYKFKIVPFGKVKPLSTSGTSGEVLTQTPPASAEHSDKPESESTLQNETPAESEQTSEKKSL